MEDEEYADKCVELENRMMALFKEGGFTVPVVLGVMSKMLGAFMAHIKVTDGDDKADSYKADVIAAIDHACEAISEGLANE